MSDGFKPTLARRIFYLSEKKNQIGNGIPAKPMGQGTGLGLSLSYDIVKTHGGELKVNTKEGEKSEFVIQLPFD